MRQIGHYDVEDPAKIQGRDEVERGDRSLAGLRLSRALEALSDVAAPGRLLVLGCGAGRYVRALARERPDLELHGGDLSLYALREARERDRRDHYVALEASTLPYRDASFVAVVFFDLLEHVPDYRGMLGEIARVLRSGGIFHFFVPLEAKPGTVYSLLRRSRRAPLNRWKRDHVGHINHFVPETVIRDVWEAGLAVDSISYSFHLSGQLHDLVDYWQRERAAGGSGLLPVPAVRALSRIIFIPTWRLSYLEDRLYSGPVLASGLHLTASKARG